MNYKVICLISITLCLNSFGVTSAVANCEGGAEASSEVEGSGDFCNLFPCRGSFADVSDEGVFCEVRPECGCKNGVCVRIHHGED